MNILIDGLFDICTHVYFSNRKGGISVELLSLKKAEHRRTDAFELRY